MPTDAAHRAPEPILDPDLPICDPHHHLWHWPHPVSFGAQRYLADEFLADVGSGHAVESTVFVDANAFYRADGPPALRPVGEVEFANGVAAMAANRRYGPTALCAGIVGFADLAAGGVVEEVLVAEIRAGGDRFRGVRNAAASDPAIPQNRPGRWPDLYDRPEFREGFARLAPLGLSFDAWIYHTQLDMLARLADAFPGTAIVLDHVGGPLGIGPYAGRREEVFRIWRAAVRDLAARSNVSVKLGGLGMGVFGFGFENQATPASSEVLAAAWRPYVETCIEAFGVRRCMFESNFPVDKITCDYRTLWNAFKRLAAGASAEERSWLFRDSARSFYRLKD